MAKLHVSSSKTSAGSSLLSALGVGVLWVGVLLLSPLFLVAGPAYLYGRFLTRPVLIFFIKAGVQTIGAWSALAGWSLESARQMLLGTGAVFVYVIGVLTIFFPLFVIDLILGDHDPFGFSRMPMPEAVVILVVIAAFAAFIFGVIGMNEQQNSLLEIEPSKECAGAYRAMLSFLYERSASRRSPVEHRYPEAAVLLREQGLRFVRRTQMQEDLWVSCNAERVVTIPVATSGIFTFASSLSFCVLAPTLTFIAIACTYFLSGGYLDNGGLILMIGVGLGIGFVICAKYAKTFASYLGQYRVKVERIVDARH